MINKNFGWVCKKGLFLPFEIKVENFLKGSLDLIPSPITFIENSNYERESLLEV